jgi:uncharacterized protein YoxC
MKHEFDILAVLHEIRDLLKKQNELLESIQPQSQTKITVVGNKPQSNSVPKAKGFNPTDDFSL